MTFRARIRPQIAVRFASLMVVTFLLVSCATGSESATSPTAVPTQPPPTARPGEISVQDLTDRINSAWSGVETLRVTSSSGPIPTESTLATPESSDSYAVEEWVAPNDRRIVEVVGGTIVNEQVYAGGVIYMRGTFVGAAVAPEVGDETWITLDQRVVPPDTPVGNRVTYLTREPSSPFVNLSKDLLVQPARESGTVQVEGRTCTVYTFGDPNGSGDQIRYEVALDENNLPCQVVQRAGGFQNSSVYEINSDDIQITAPDAGTPVSGTPEG